MSMIEKVQNMYRDFESSFSNIQINIWIVISVAIIYMALYFVRNRPVIANIKILFGFIPTLIHEMGHAIGARITGGRVENIHIILTKRGMNKTGSLGYAQTSPSGFFSGIIMSVLGYIFPPLLFLLGFYFVSIDKSFIYIGILILMALYYLKKTSQKWIPILILLLLFYSGYDLKMNDMSMISGLMFTGYSVILGLLLGEIIQSLLITTQFTFDSGDDSSDGYQLSERTVIVPKFVWYVLWTLFSLYAIIKSFTLYL